MANTDRFPYVMADPRYGDMSLEPRLPLALSYENRSVQALALLDTGAAVSVMPYTLGLELGAVWEEQSMRLRLTGNLSRMEARALVVTATIGGFAPVQLAFAWTQAENAPLLLGQMNFFQEFDVCFYRLQRAFELRVASAE